MKYLTATFAAALCATSLAGPPVYAQAVTHSPETVHSAEQQKFEQDRAAILAMAGDYKVQFKFTETVAFTKGYEPKDPYLSGGYEIVRVIEDRGDFISLQHILVVGGEQKMPIKHWRQDWQYQPNKVLNFIGGNAWEMRDVSEEDSAGSWSQAVYQVDDSPRYGAVGYWSHENGMSEWVPPAEWRPLPRRDMTKRDDYHAVVAMNRHAITPDGWVHEQDNSKLALDGEARVLVREVGVNTYVKSDAFPTEIGDEYWAKTADYWAGVRDIWTGMEAAGRPFALTQKGEPDQLYMPLMNLAGEVAAGDKSADAAIIEAKAVIADKTTTDLPPLAERLRERAEKVDY
ncbi:hypothetical protein QWY75_11085 [Pontixanthobacter aestiaquae]|uniref:Uncharacterized protein n=1 Tax=Pontixanthobacter aestiaquae TaxID=1509367 RepID=A0A844Z4K1_9SPHN|nr:DUF6607 family protein [Pontixanthobacter aestiaquae]MDN3646745.1 hypothetical protein [Pontixanthobacter aestiaquae]MXO82272.1 hypothetical protein [Pontixanthobacter aestiaquae]